MIKYKGFIIEHEFGISWDAYYIYEPKHWELIKTFRNYELHDIKEYIDKRIERG